MKNRLAILFCVMLFVMGGCVSNGNRLAGSAGEDYVDCFRPADIQFQPSFTRFMTVSDEAGNDKEVVSAYVVLVDGYGDPVKALGAFRFELYRHRSAAAARDLKGDRFEDWGVQEFDLTHCQDNQSHWDNTVRLYRFDLELPADLGNQKQIVLEVTYSEPGRRGRLESTLVVGRSR